MATYRVVELTDGTGTGTGLYRFCEVVNGTPVPVGYCAGSCPGHSSASDARQHFLAFVHEHDFQVVTADEADYYYDPLTGFYTWTFIVSDRLGVRIPISAVRARDLPTTVTTGYFTTAMVTALEG